MTLRRRMSQEEGSEPVRRAEDRAVYIISVAAELAGVHPQTLRIYERKGLLTPARTAGNTRRYSERDIRRLRTIQRLTQEEGLNLAGVKMIVEMEDQLDRMRRRVASMSREMQRASRRMQEHLDRLQREYAPQRRTEIVPLSSMRGAMSRWQSAQGSPGAPDRAPRGPIPVGASELEEWQR